MAKIIYLTVFLTTIVSAVADIIIDDSEFGVKHMTILPGGTKLCSQSNNSHSSSAQDRKLSVNETVYIFMNETFFLGLHSSCFKHKHFIKFISNRWYNQVNRKNILQIKLTTDGLVIDTEDDIEYSKKDLANINSELTNGVERCRLLGSHHVNINIMERDKYSWFMDKCELVFDRKSEDICGINHGEIGIEDAKFYYQSNKKSNFYFDTVVIKPSPIYDMVEIRSVYCNDHSHITEFIPSDFLNSWEFIESWFKFDYNVIDSGSSSSLSISIAGIPIDYINYDTVCYDFYIEPKFYFKGIKDIKSVCNNFNQLFNPDFIYNSQNIINNHETPYYTYTPEDTTSYVFNFPYIVILLMILISKAICGYAIYKRRQARLVTYTSRILAEHYGNISPIIVAANGADYPGQPTNQYESPRQPSEDLPPAYNDLQHHTDINPPGYEDACKSQSNSPPGHENLGFQIESETSSVNHITGSLERNQISTNDHSAVSSDSS